MVSSLSLSFPSSLSVIPSWLSSLIISGSDTKKTALHQFSELHLFKSILNLSLTHTLYLVISSSPLLIKHWLIQWGNVLNDAINPSVFYMLPKTSSHDSSKAPLMLPYNNYPHFVLFPLAQEMNTYFFSASYMLSPTMDGWNIYQYH